MAYSTVGLSVTLVVLFVATVSAAPTGSFFGFLRNLCRVQGCTKIYDPVCGTDENTYSNECVLRVETCWQFFPPVRVAYKGECVNKPVVPDCNQLQFCIALYDPVCGSDGKTYSNSCRLRADTCGKVPAVSEVHKGPCVTTTKKPDIIGPDCDQIMCPAVYDPVCGTDGQTYSNSCSLGAANRCRGPADQVDIAYQGACDEVALI